MQRDSSQTKGCKMADISGIVSSRYPQAFGKRALPTQRTPLRLFTFNTLCQNLPQQYPTLILCWKQPALPQHLVFTLWVLLLCLFRIAGGPSNDRDRTGDAT